MLRELTSPANGYLFMEVLIINDSPTYLMNANEIFREENTTFS
jgi:hypothetical protein